MFSGEPTCSTCSHLPTFTHVDTRRSLALPCTSSPQASLFTSWGCARKDLRRRLKVCASISSKEVSGVLILFSQEGL
ncbi:hypothetical protein E2C01_088316 [Portunus trituberculatus]|uniref:Uncharacterized protein n=1 Tax=Portunus trituberculatus TaxID=210409 RepID=A0A5B7JLL4_PORTR|nr:hypothetical protein [Portunus trituberculatus]